MLALFPFIALTVIEATAARQNKVARLIANARMSRQYLAQSDVEARATLEQSLAKLNYPQSIRVKIAALAGMSREIYKSHKEATNAILKLPLRQRDFSRILDKVIIDTEGAIKAAVDKISPFSGSAIVAKLDPVSQALVVAARPSGLTAMGRAHRISEGLKVYRTAVVGVLKEIEDQVVDTISAIRTSHAEDGVALRVFDMLMRPDSEDADRVAVHVDRRFHKMVVSYAGKPVDEKLMDAYRRYRLSWMVFMVETDRFNLFVLHCNHYYNRFFVALPSGSPRYAPSMKLLQEHEKLVRAKDEASKNLTPLLETVGKLTELAKWYDRTPQPSHLRKLNDAYDIYFAVRMKHSALNKDENVAFDILVEFATG